MYFKRVEIAINRSGQNRLVHLIFFSRLYNWPHLKRRNDLEKEKVKFPIIFSFVTHSSQFTIKCPNGILLKWSKCMKGLRSYQTKLLCRARAHLFPPLEVTQPILLFPASILCIKAWLCTERCQLSCHGSCASTTVLSPPSICGGACRWFQPHTDVNSRIPCLRYLSVIIYSHYLCHFMDILCIVL